jgi:dynein heavy chain
VSRVDALQRWIDEALPRCFWLPGFTYPTGFLTALLQTSARKNGIAIDTLSWEFPVVNTSAPSITQHAKDGSYCYGLFLEGSRWDFDNSCLTNPTPMELFCSMPVIHFKPVENKKKSSKGMYSCPLYMYPLRTGSRERPSFVISCDVKSGVQTSDYWTLSSASHETRYIFEREFRIVCICLFQVSGNCDASLHNLLSTWNRIIFLRGFATKLLIVAIGCHSSTLLESLATSKHCSGTLGDQQKIGMQHCPY